MANNRGGLGPQGFRGPQGVQGPTGPQGLQGPTGYTGTQGSTGIKGDVGKGFIVHKSGEGYPNPDDFSDEHIGEFYLKKGGDLYCYIPETPANETSGDRQDFKYVGDVTDESVLVGPTGPAGTKGDTGPTGPSIDPSFLDSKANLASPTFTGTVSGITSEMVKPNNIIINNSDIDSSGNFILNSNNFKDGFSIISSSNLSTVGNGLQNICNALCAVSNSDGSTDIYIGGQFTTAYNNGTTIIPGTGYICKYNTLTGLYTAVGAGLNGSCYALCAVPNSTDIYIGGQFTSAYNTGITTIPGTSRICKYNTVTGLYTAVGNGLQSTCNALCAVSNSNGSTDIYIGGTFSSATNSNGTVVNVNCICKYNTTSNTYSAVGPGLSGPCAALCGVSNTNGSTDIYIGGNFLFVSNVDDTPFICKYNTISGVFSSVKNGLNGPCYAICAVSNSNGSTDIYIGGNFTTAYNQYTTIPGTSYICKYNTGTNLYTTVGNGLQNICYTICALPNSNDLYIGGNFTSAYNTGTTIITATSRICKYNTGTGLYSSLGASLNGSSCRALCLVPNSNDIYIGGSFTSIDYLNSPSLSVNNICKINNIKIYYKNTLISSINYPNPFEVIQKNTINNKEYITLLGSNKKFLI